MSPPAVRRGSPPQQSFAATFQCRGPEVPLWDVGSSIRRLPPIGGCIVRSWQTRLRKLFKLANVPNGHAHRFRDTFAVELLLAGVPIERVSILLGHQSVRITEKHYAHGCGRDRNNWKRIWLTPGAAIRSFSCKETYIRGTRKAARQQLVHLQ